MARGNRRTVVFTNAKILILKLITTNNPHPTSSVCCIYQCKDTNFKANHNVSCERLLTTQLYLPMQRY